MATITLHDVDEGLLARLAGQARLHDRSIEAEIKTVLGEAVDRASLAAARVATSKRLQAMTPKDVVQTDSTLLLREDRDR